MTIDDGWALTFVKWAAAILYSLWTPMPLALQMLCIMSLCEMATGFFNPRRRFFASLQQVTVSLILTFLVCWLYDKAHVQAGFNLGFDICSGVAMFYCLGSAIKIMQDVQSVGGSVPPVLISLMHRAEGLTGTERYDLDALQLKQDQDDKAMTLKHEQENSALNKKQQDG